MKDRVFIDPPDPKKLRVGDFYHLKWILISIGIVSISIIIQYFQDPATIGIVGFFNITLIENVSPIISVASSIIAAIIISPIVEFEWMLLKEILKKMG